MNNSTDKKQKPDKSWYLYPNLIIYPGTRHHLTLEHRGQITGDRGQVAGKVPGGLRENRHLSVLWSLRGTLLHSKTSIADTQARRVVKMLDVKNAFNSTLT